MPSKIKAQPWHTTHPASESLSIQNHQDQKTLASLVPRKFENLEFWVLFFCGIYGLLVTVLVAHGSWMSALSFMALLCLAAWRRRRPARTQSQWVAGAFVALALVCSVYVDPVARGNLAPYLYLLGIMAMTYPLLMDTRWATVYSVCLVAVFLFSMRFKAIDVTTELVVLRTALLAGLCGLSMRLGAVLRQLEGSVEHLRHDIASLAYNEHGLMRYGGRLLGQCSTKVQPCTLALLSMPKDWFNALHIDGQSSDFSATKSAKIQNQALRDMRRNLSQALPHDALVSRSQQGDWIVLVPWCNRAHVLAQLESAFGRPLQLLFGPRSEEMFVAITPCLVESTGGGDSIESMLSRAYDIWQRGVRTGVVDNS
jgi:hypothetical protein